MKTLLTIIFIFTACTANAANVDLSTNSHFLAGCDIGARDAQRHAKQENPTTRPFLVERCQEMLRNDKETQARFPKFISDKQLFVVGCAFGMAAGLMQYDVQRIQTTELDKMFQKCLAYANERVPPAQNPQ